jgi:hypothetical protein
LLAERAALQASPLHTYETYLYAHTYTPRPPASYVAQHGNAKYEHSILRAAGGLDWKPLVEEAAAKFREAGELLLSWR